MKSHAIPKRLLACACALSLLCGSALAEKPEWAGGGRHKEDKVQRARVQDTDAARLGFGSAERRVVIEYYGAEASKGRCPPGLAKKHNGCQPPGQAKQWQKGAPLAQDLRYYELPRELRLRLPPPPPNHRYVRIAGDVLLIAVGTRMVVDAIEDILR